jgi:exosortase A
MYCVPHWQIASRRPYEGRCDGLGLPNAELPIMNAPVMNAPIMSEARHEVSVGWRTALPALAGGLLLLGLLFNREVTAAIQTWNASTAYNHCFLVIPIVFYLLWDRRRDLAGIPPHPMPIAVLFGIPLAATWLISERLGIMEGRQLLTVGFVQILFLAVLGKRLWRAMAGPLLYLFFLVPFGEFLTPKLQDVTTFFISHGLYILGVPAYIDGYVIEIPQGTFFVAEACAGLRFLIASVAFGCLYALLMYRSPMRRGVFILVSIVVPVIANGFRGLGIVYLGYILGDAQAAAADHVIYGWVFFSVVMLILIAAGLPFRQDYTPPHSALSSVKEDGPVPPLRRILAVVLGIVVVAAVGPAVAAGLAAAAETQVQTPARIDIGANCVVQPEPAVGGAAIKSERVSCGDVSVDLRWEAFSPRATAASVMAARRQMVAGALTEGLQENWLDSGDGSPSAWRIMKSRDPPYVTAVSVWIGGKPIRPGLAMRLRMAVSSLMGSAYAPAVMTVTPAVNWEARDAAQFTAAEDALPRFLLTHPELDQKVGASSELH